MYGELEKGTRVTGRPKLNYRDVLKRDLRSSDINLQTWEQSAIDCTAWRQVVQVGVSASEAKRAEASPEKIPTGPNAKEYRCQGCSRDCHSEFGLFSHRRACK
jgi:hypothetical protein